jgi:hypothetical protein
MMQQTVLLTAIRGPDGMPKYGAAKRLLRWYRRCILISALDGEILTTPWDARGGSFTGPSIQTITLQAAAERYVGDLEARSREARELLEAGSLTSLDAYNLAADDATAFAEAHLGGWEPFMSKEVDGYLKGVDAIPHHFQLHFMHAAEIVGYKHPDNRIRSWWLKTYERLVHDMHLWPETEAQLDARLGDSRDGWLERADPATVD